MRIKLFTLLALLLCCCSLASAQAPSHQVAMSVTASTTTGIAGYNVYRATCPTIATCPTPSLSTFTKLTATPIAATTYTDSTAQGGALYSFFWTAVCPAAGCGGGLAGESGPSTNVTATIPTTPPNPPTNLTITSLAELRLGRDENALSAKWESPYSLTDWEVLAANGRVLDRGVSDLSVDHVFSLTTTVPNQARRFKVCDGSGCRVDVIARR